MPLTQPLWSNWSQHRWLLIVLDSTGKIVDIPQADVVSIEAEDLLNGGSGQATIIFSRDYNNIGQIAYGYTCLLWFWRSRDDILLSGSSYKTYPNTLQPHPWYAGHIVDIDDKMLLTDGVVECKLEGEMKLLDRAIVTESISPNVGGNGNLAAQDYLAHILTTYQPASFGSPVIPVSMFNLFPNSFDGAKLGACIDTICKQGRDASGVLFTWAVRATFNLFGYGGSPPINSLGRNVIVSPDQNPAVLSTAVYKNVFVRAQTAGDYHVQTLYRDIVNVVAIYGGKDPATGQTAYGQFQDASSVALFGAIEDKLHVDYLRSNAACAAYADTYFDINAFPQAQGEFTLMDPDPSVLAGTWCQMMEYATSSYTTTQKKQVRCSAVKVSIKGERIEQTISTVSPTPYLDAAIYRMGLHVNGNTATAVKRLGINTQNLFVRAGGKITAQSSGPATVTFSAAESVFPSGLLTAPGLTLTLAADTAYTIIHDQASNTIQAVIGDVAPSPLKQPLAHVTTVGTVPYAEDRRFQSVTVAAVNGIITHSGAVNIPVENLSDVVITAVADGDVLTWKASASKWENIAPAGGGGGSAPTNIAFPGTGTNPTLVAANTAASGTLPTSAQGKTIRAVALLQMKSSGTTTVGLQIGKNTTNGILCQVTNIATIGIFKNVASVYTSLGNMTYEGNNMATDMLVRMEVEIYVAAANNNLITVRARGGNASAHFYAVASGLDTSMDFTAQAVAFATNETENVWLCSADESTFLYH